MVAAEWRKGGKISERDNENYFRVVGGLAIFIYGMNMMSECLQKAAGKR